MVVFVLYCNVFYHHTDSPLCLPLHMDNILETHFSLMQCSIINPILFHKIESTNKVMLSIKVDCVVLYYMIQVSGLGYVDHVDHRLHGPQHTLSSGT